MTLAFDHLVPVPIHGLLRQYPVPALNPEHYDEVLVRLSNAARVNQIYVVINIEELMNCTVVLEGENCPNNTNFRFNTNVVFDRNGAVIDRYRKINLFGELSRTPALTPDLGYFATDFGVRFGHFICFDLMFQVPAVQVVQKFNVTDVIFTTMWFSQMPYLTAVQIQEAYAYAQNVNFLAAGANNVRVGSAGSGIYSGKLRALASVMSGTDTTKLLVERVPKIPGRVNWTYTGPEHDLPRTQDNLYLKRDPSVSAHVTRVLVPGYQEFALSHNEVTCTFKINMTSRGGAKVPSYRASAQDGANTHGRRSIGVASCAVFACENDNITSCPYRKSSPQPDIVFEELEIEMKTHKHRYNNTLNCDNVVYFPSTLQRNNLPLNPDRFTFTERLQDGDVIQDGGQQNVTMKLKETEYDLLTFGIYGRIYDRDVNIDKGVTDDERRKFLKFIDFIYSNREIAK
ncbi:Vanin-like protein 1 [Eumeta japonica]|uniref:Vanin-like protein 1 n=1 Tax=Eumeta variegata TaxID=151549 RepID=A0A4C2ABH7_EUMVA|nr:Vanin-like protein 1 [Eumeta japonica]